MKFKKIIKLFEYGNVCVCGLRGTGKDLLTGNVIARRRLQYVSNVDYGGLHNPFSYKGIDCGENTYENFITGKVKRYVYPYGDNVDVYLSDAGVYFPSQYCGDLNKRYQYMSVFQALSRHVGQCNFHFNAQNLNRVWDKIREQSDTYILCRSCWYFHGIVLQRVTIYNRYQSAVDRQKPLYLPLPLFANKEMKLQRKMEYARFEAQHGIIRTGILLYRNKSTYDTRLFKRMLEEGETK